MTRVPVPVGVRRFLESYRDAFDRLDPDAIAAHFCVPSVMAMNAGYTVWDDVAAIRQIVCGVLEEARPQFKVSSEF